MPDEPLPLFLLNEVPHVENVKEAGAAFSKVVQHVLHIISLMLLTATTGINRFIPCFEQTESFSLFCFFSEVTTCIPALHYSILPYHLIGLWL